MGWLLFGLGLAAGVVFLWTAHARARRLCPIPDAVATRSISELEAGRFRIVGRVVPTQTITSRVDSARCVMIEHAEYRTIGSALVPLLREVDHGCVAHPFFLDDGTGRVLIHPAQTEIEAVTVYEDAGLYAERRLRVGEEVELVASFALPTVSGDAGPYRSSHLAYAPVGDSTGSPRLSFRTEPSMLPAGDELCMFFRGAGALVLGLSLCLGALSLL